MSAKRNIRLRVEYEGTRYAGFQAQANARTIAGELKSALVDLLAEPITLIAAGRTDAGVHAEGQIANFLTGSTLGLREIREGLNDRLPADINVLAAEAAEPGFHARSQATARHYRFQVSTRRDAFRKRLVWWVRSPLDPGRLQAEAEAVPGTHDFASFTDPAEGDARIAVHAAAWSREDSLLVFRISAGRFVYKMVRRLVGAMVEVGLGREPAGLVAGLLADPRPGAAAPWTAPPSGLFLERVDYARGFSRRSGSC